MTRRPMYPDATWTAGTCGSFEGTAFAPMDHTSGSVYHLSDVPPFPQESPFLTRNEIPWVNKRIEEIPLPLRDMHESKYTFVAPVVVQYPEQRPSLAPPNLKVPEDKLHPKPMAAPTVSLVIQGMPRPPSLSEPEPDPWRPSGQIVVFGGKPGPGDSPDREPQYVIDLEAIRNVIAQTLQQIPRPKVGPPPVLWIQVPVYPVTHGR